MQPTSKFGEVFQYSNLMAAAAEYIGAHLTYPNRELGAAYASRIGSKSCLDPGQLAAWIPVNLFHSFFGSP